MHSQKAILITYPYEDSIKEALSLCDAAGYFITDIIKQKHITRSKFGIGSGKASEVKELILKNRVKNIIFDEVLKPKQQYNLTKLCNAQVIDRERLILEIFEKRATNAESNIQIKLAQLKYDMVRTREKVRLAKLGEQPGFFGLGKYDADVYLLDLRKRIVNLQRKLKKEELRKKLYRKSRSKSGFPVISFVGYTSAGKTTLFNRLAGETKITGKGMFTTLSTFTRNVTLRDGKILLSDTVGFISKLPAYMIDAFKSTLLELTYSDLILLVIDISQNIHEIKKKLKSSMIVMNELLIPTTKVVYLLNKVDLTTIDEAYQNFYNLGITDSQINVLPVSALTGYNLEKLKSLINNIVFSNQNSKTIQKHNNIENKEVKLK